MKSSPCLPQLEKVHMQQKGPSAVKKKVQLSKTEPERNRKYEQTNHK